MKSKNYLWITIIIVILLLVFTNPNKRQLTKYIVNSEMKKVDNILNKSVGNYLISLFNKEIDEKSTVFNEIIIRQNFFIFSIYEIDIPFTENDLKYLGLFNTFIKL